jgi:hypothetical protein
MRYEGYNGSLTVEGDRLVVRRDTRAGRIGFGKEVPPRYIPLQAISAADLKPASRLVNGWLRLQLGGETDRPPPTMTSAAGDPDVIMFTWSQHEMFVRLHGWLQQVIAQTRASGAGFAHAPEGQAGRLERRVEASRQRQAELAERSANLRGLSDQKEDARNLTKAEKYIAAGIRSDIATAAGRLRNTIGGGREIKKLHQHLLADERVEMLAQGRYDGDQGLLALTDQRLIFVFHGVTRQRVEDFPLAVITSIQNTAGLVFGEISVHASGNKAVIDQIAKPDAASITDAVRAGMVKLRAPSPSPAPPAPPAAVSQPVPPAPQAPQADVLDQIRKLADLRDAGVLSEDEFTTKKAELLRRL